jgi:uncharacterized membrane protein YjjP (DUF1212 family)/uncharacterized membrane protein YjjB (DUF3815 family)
MEAESEERTRPGPGLSLEQATSLLLLDLGQALHAAALPSDIVERRLRAAARGLGTRAQVLVLQGFIAVQTGPGPAGAVELRRISFDTHWNLRRLEALVGLCASLARGERGLTEGRAELERILHEPLAYAKGLVVLAYGVYGAAVAVRVGGGLMEALVGGLVGLVAGGLHFGTLAYGPVDLQKSFLAGLVGSLAALALSLVLPPFDTGRAVFGGMTLMVPAMVLTIGTHELASDALESGVARLAYGLLRFLMLAIGIAGAVKLWMFAAVLPVHVAAAPLPWPAALAVVAIGGAALTVCLQGRSRDVLWMAGAAVFAYGAQALTRALFGGDGSPLVAALLLGVAANLQARAGRLPAVVLVPGLLQLAPGFLGSEAVMGLLGRGGGPSGPHLVDVLMTALQLVMGLVLAEVLSGRRTLPLVEGRAPAPAH